MDRDETGRAFVCAADAAHSMIQKRGWLVDRIRPITGGLDHIESRWHTFSMKPEAVEVESLVKVIVPIKHSARWTGANPRNSTWTVRAK